MQIDIRKAKEIKPILLKLGNIMSKPKKLIEQINEENTIIRKKKPIDRYLLNFSSGPIILC